jgi:hypothetical protein
MKGFQQGYPEEQGKNSEALAEAKPLHKKN